MANTPLNKVKDKWDLEKKFTKYVIMRDGYLEYCKNSNKSITSGKKHNTDRENTET